MQNTAYYRTDLVFNISNRNYKHTQKTIIYTDYD